VSRDWARWHEGYDDPCSPLNDRLALVQRHLSDALATAPPGPVRVVSLCAGQGRDVLGVLPGHPRRADVRAVLVELDPRIAAQAAQRAAQAGLASVEVRVADAAIVAGYADVIPADVLLLCGIFGNVTEGDIARTIAAAQALCAPGGTVIWTRHRRPPDLTPRLRQWFADAGFGEVAFDSPGAATTLSVGAHRRPPGAAAAADAGPLIAERLFTFTYTAAARPEGTTGEAPRA
jgi:hypothetical protein